MSRRFVVVLFHTCLLVAVAHASAFAATEFCPANLVRVYTKSSKPPATVQYYYLRALASRVVDGVIVAETDSGWFTWTQEPVQLSRTTYVNASPTVKSWFHVAESPELTVAFPQAVTVQHAWVATARTHGDGFFNWDAQGTVTCDPPVFALSKYPSTPSERTPQAGDETPAPAPPPANAVASAAPFPVLTCDKPFVTATVTDAVQPEFPRIVESEGFSGSAISEIAVAIDPSGKLVDAWVWAKSGYPALDDAALKAARRSKYSGAISYCRPVHATYLFRADFLAH